MGSSINGNGLYFQFIALDKEYIEPKYGTPQPGPITAKDLQPLQIGITPSGSLIVSPALGCFRRISGDENTATKLLFPNGWSITGEMPTEDITFQSKEEDVIISLMDMYNRITSFSVDGFVKEVDWPMNDKINKYQSEILRVDTFYEFGYDDSDDALKNGNGLQLAQYLDYDTTIGLSLFTTKQPGYHDELGYNIVKLGISDEVVLKLKRDEDKRSIHLLMPDIEHDEVADFGISMCSVDNNEGNEVQDNKRICIGQFIDMSKKDEYENKYEMFSYSIDIDKSGLSYSLTRPFMAQDYNEHSQSIVFGRENNKFALDITIGNELGITASQVGGFCDNATKEVSPVTYIDYVMTTGKITNFSIYDKTNNCTISGSGIDVNMDNLLEMLIKNDNISYMTNYTVMDGDIPVDTGIWSTEVKGTLQSTLQYTQADGYESTYCLFGNPDANRLFFWSENIYHHVKLGDNLHAELDFWVWGEFSRVQIHGDNGRFEIFSNGIESHTLLSNWGTTFTMCQSEYDYVSTRIDNAHHDGVLEMTRVNSWGVGWLYLASESAGGSLDIMNSGDIHDPNGDYLELSKYRYNNDCPDLPLVSVYGKIRITERAHLAITRAKDNVGTPTSGAGIVGTYAGLTMFLGDGGIVHTNDDTVTDTTLVWTEEIETQPSQRQLRHESLVKIVKRVLKGFEDTGRHTWDHSKMNHSLTGG